MAEALSSSQVAQKLDTDARTLRRFLRDDATYRNAGSGGRYTFTERDLPTLRKRFASWQAGVAQRKAKRDITGLKKPKRAEVEPDVIVIPKCTPYLRALEREQIERLEMRLRECGLSVTQMRTRPNWQPLDAGVEAFAS